MSTVTVRTRSRYQRRSTEEKLKTVITRAQCLTLLFSLSCPATEESRYRADAVAAGSFLFSCVVRPPLIDNVTGILQSARKQTFVKHACNHYVRYSASAEFPTARSGRRQQATHPELPLLGKHRESSTVFAKSCFHDNI